MEKWIMKTKMFLLFREVRAFLGHFFLHVGEKPLEIHIDKRDSLIPLRDCDEGISWLETEKLARFFGDDNLSFGSDRDASKDPHSVFFALFVHGYELS
ncbi:MAG TPA: hypothetical protein PK765_07750 [bacterium]|nr:hypothetical protein [bacterium]